MTGPVHITFFLLSSNFLRRISLITETNLKQEKGNPKVNLTMLAFPKAIKVSVRQIDTHREPLREDKSRGF